MKCQVNDPIFGTNAVAEFEGKLTDDSHRLTRTVIDLLCLEMDLDDEILVSDEVKDGSRVLTWNWKDRDYGRHSPMPITFTFTE